MKNKPFDLFGVKVTICDVKLDEAVVETKFRIATSKCLNQEEQNKLFNKVGYYLYTEGFLDEPLEMV